MSIIETVKELSLPIIEAEGLKLWDIEFKKEGSEYFLRIYIDSEKGITINDCESVSRKVEVLLDEKDPIEQSYYLEVSSAGLIRELKTETHINHFIGHEAEIHMYKAYADLGKKFAAILKSVDKDNLSVEKNGVFLTLKRSDISQIKIDLL